MIALIQYNAGNIGSVGNALDRLGVPYKVTGDSEEIVKADKVIFPGVGEASSAMSFLKMKGLDELIPTLSQPVLGICLGMQLMCMNSEEGNTGGLGIFPTRVLAFPKEDLVPHMGWNNFTTCGGPLFDQVLASSDVYYVHSYYAEICDATAAICDYIRPFSAALNSGNFYGTQFHPEKSAGVGQQVLKNFLEL